ncbi:unnamed protein product [Closterium sp. NIES-53]
MSLYTSLCRAIPQSSPCVSLLRVLPPSLRPSPRPRRRPPRAQCVRPLASETHPPLSSHVRTSCLRCLRLLRPQDVQAEGVRRKKRTATKVHSRSIVGASLEVIQKRRSEKAEVRAAARDAALRSVAPRRPERLKKVKDEKKAKKAEVTTKQAKAATKAAAPRASGPKGGKGASGGGGGKR